MENMLKCELPTHMVERGMYVFDGSQWIMIEYVYWDGRYQYLIYWTEGERYLVNMQPTLFVGIPHEILIGWGTEDQMLAYFLAFMYDHSDTNQTQMIEGMRLYKEGRGSERPTSE